MICDSCGESFEVAEDLKKLIGTGAVPQVCDQCAVLPPDTGVAPRVQESEQRTPASVLQRVDPELEGLVRMDLFEDRIASEELAAVL